MIIRTTSKLLAVMACVAALGAGPLFAEKALFDRATLKGKKTELPLRYHFRGGDNVEVEGSLLVTHTDRFLAVHDLQTGKQLWKKICGDAEELAYLGVSKGVLLFTVIPFEPNKDPKRDLQCTVERIQFPEAVELPPLALPLTEEETAGQNIPRAVLSVGERFIVLSDEFALRKPRPSDRKLLSFRLTAFRTSDGGVEWSHREVAGPALRGPNAFLLGSQGPMHDSANLQPLTLMGSRVIVCAGPHDDIISIVPDNGQESWRITRLWEYRRYFVGPSVWNHFLSRFGVGIFELDHWDLSLDEYLAKAGSSDVPQIRESLTHQYTSARKRAERIKSDQCWLLAGPIVATDPSGDAAMFIVTSRADAMEDWPNYNSQWIAYEIDKDGRPIGMQEIPKMVNGREYLVRRNSVIWWCDDNGVLELFPQEVFWHPSAFIKFKWHEEAFPPKPDAFWMRDFYYPCRAIHAVETLTNTLGDHMVRRDSRELTFRLQLQQLQEQGSTEDLLLRLPYDGPINPPPDPKHFVWKLAMTVDVIVVLIVSDINNEDRQTEVLVFDRIGD